MLSYIGCHATASPPGKFGQEATLLLSSLSFCNSTTLKFNLPTIRGVVNDGTITTYSFPQTRRTKIWI
jgi:hypothetical protein